MNTNFHTESRMREICTYGSMRGSRRKTAKSVLRVAEGRADVPCGGVSPYSTPFSVPVEAYDLVADPGETNNLVRAGASLPKEAQDLIPHLKPNEK